MDFQTPDWVCKIMVDMIDINPNTILEPTPGEGNLVKEIKNRFRCAEIIAPVDFMALSGDVRYDIIVANPPFTPMSLGYSMLDRFFMLSDNIIVIMPWLTLINSEKRTSSLIQHGLKEIVHLPRRAFNGARVQTCIMRFCKGYQGDIQFRVAKSDASPNGQTAKVGED